MKNLCKFFLALSVYTSAFSQITEITRLPVQDNSQSIKESAPVWLSENEILIFYANQTNDTIFSSRSINRGKSWGESSIVQVVSLVNPNQAELYLTSLFTSGGRILLAWSVLFESMKVIYSDDKGINWSQPISIMGSGSGIFLKSSHLLNLTQWENNAICLSFSNISLSSGYYKLSYDNGVTWSTDPFQFPVIAGNQIKNLSIISTGGNNLLAVFEKSALDVNGVYSRLSTDNGISWSEPYVIADDVYHEIRPQATRHLNGNIIVTYVRNNLEIATSYDDNDLFYKTSTDNGLTWSPEIRITKYVGEDNYIKPSSFQNKTFITFATERFSVLDPNRSTYQIVYGVIGESVEKFTPPKIYDAYAPQELIDFENRQFVYRARVIDDDSVKKVKLALEDSLFIGEMFDDGLHNDGEANDKVFANTFPIINARYLDGYSMDVNKIKLPLNNKGIIADVEINYGQRGIITASDLEDNTAFTERDIYFGGSISYGRYEEGVFLFSAGFILSGYSDGTLWSNAVASSMLVEDYLPGTVNSNPDDPLFVLYVVGKNDIPFGPSWQRWKDAVSLGAEFYDGDGDGIYNPVDKNWNGTWDLNEDMPLLIGDETAWCVYNDALPREVRRWNTVDPQGIEVRQTIFATTQPGLKNVIFIRYSILNTGTVSDIMDSVYFAIWEDADLGDNTDDAVGCDTTLNSGFYYNNKTDAIYGENCPAFFTAFLQGPIVNTNNPSDTAKNNFGELIGSEIFIGSENLNMTSHVFFIGGDPNLNDPDNATQARCYSEGKTRLCVYPDPCTFPYCEVRGGVNCNEINPRFWASGDPVTQIGWLNNVNREQRNLISTGPFLLEKSKPQEIIAAYVMGRGTDYFNSITVARENVQRAIQEYQSNFASLTYTPPAATNPVTNYVLYQNYPNPFNPITTIRYELPQDGVVTLELFDILGQKVKTIVNQFQKANRYEVTLNSAGLASGVYIYRMKANDFIISKKMLLIR
jgi:hypothetical protein